MEINKILSSNYLDIIFDGRNKEYGAYELRTSYNGRLTKSLVVTASILLLLITVYLFANKFTVSSQPDKAPDIHLVEIITDVIQPVIPPVVKPKPEPLIIETKKYTAPLIVNYQVKEDDKTPELEQLIDVKIGAINQPGVKDEGGPNAPEEDGKRGIMMAPKKDINHDDEIFRKVEIESVYPGGTSAWMRYLNKTFRYPAEAQDINIQGTVVVQFIVDAEGNVSNVEAIEGPITGGLRDEAVRVIRKSGKWEPAIQNGRKVKSYKKQPITFKMEEQ